MRCGNFDYYPVQYNGAHADHLLHLQNIQAEDKRPSWNDQSQNGKVSILCIYLYK